MHLKFQLNQKQGSRSNLACKICLQTNIGIGETELKENIVIRRGDTLIFVEGYALLFTAITDIHNNKAT